MAKKESCDKLAHTPIIKAENSSNANPTPVSFSMMETRRMAASAILMPILPTVMSCMYLYLLLRMW